MTEIHIRPYQDRDLIPIREIFIDWNRSIAPEGQEDKFEAYIERSLAEEIERIPGYYAPEGWGFWVVEIETSLPGGATGPSSEMTNPPPGAIPPPHAQDTETPRKIIAGCYGLEGLPDDFGAVEVRRMYVAASHRRQGIGRKMMADAEKQAAELGYERIVLSTSELQPQAKSLYEATGYRLVREEQAEAPSNRTVGGGIRRFYFEKPLG